MADETHKPLHARFVVQALAWAVAIAVLWSVDLWTKFAERTYLVFGKDEFRLVVEQATSGLGALVMVAFVVRWMQVFPLTSGRWIGSAVGHVAGTALFAFGHYSLLVVQRSIVYGVLGVPYIWRENFVYNLVVEYQKDIKIYLGMVVIVLLWRQYFGAGGDEPAADPPARLRVQTGTGEAFVLVADIDYLESARNYVSVHARGREYLVRQTLSKLAERLGDGPFVRVHRRFVVNIERIVEVRSTESGTRVVMEGDIVVPLSRGYRDALKDAIGL